MAFRLAMRQFASAVHIATTAGLAGQRGVTVSAACSVSDQPATVLVCLNRSHEENGRFAKNGCFALNCLTTGHLELARGFAGEGHLSQEARFERATWDRMETGAPCLVGAAAVFDCEITDMKDVATHTVLFGLVHGVRHDPSSTPLLYHRQAYRMIGA